MHGRGLTGRAIFLASAKHSFIWVHLGLFGGIWPQLLSCPNSSKYSTRSKIAHLLDVWSLLYKKSRSCTRRFHLYKPGPLTFSNFFAFLSLFLHPFRENLISKYQKVAPKVNK